MPRRQTVLTVLTCCALILLASPAFGERGPNLVQLRQAIRNNPQDPKAYYNLGMKYKELGRPGPAAKYLKEAIRLKSGYPEALEALAQLNNAQGDYGAAVQDFKKMMKLQPKSSELRDRLSNEYNQQGLALLQENRFSEAEAAFRKSAEGSPEAASAPLNNLGVAYFSADQPEKAVGAFRDAVNQDANNPEAHYNLGLAYLSAGNKVAAYAEFLNLRNLNPDLAHQLDYLTNFPQRRSEYQDKVLR